MVAFEIYEDLQGGFRWRLRGAHGEVLALSPDRHKALWPLEGAIEAVRTGGAQVQVRRQGRTYDWLMREAKGGVLAQAAGQYASKRACEEAIAEVLRQASSARIVEVPWCWGGVDGPSLAAVA